LTVPRRSARGRWSAVKIYAIYGFGGSSETRGAGVRARRFRGVQPGKLPCGGFLGLLFFAAQIGSTGKTCAQSPRLAPPGRVLAGLAALVLIALVALATRLEPDERGWGTHEQIGWARCWMQQHWGRPCPTCGMTTAWAYAVRGDALAAVDANAGGLVLLVATLMTAAWLAVGAVTGRMVGGWPRPRTATWLATAWLVVTLMDWARRLAG
jgi:hypothetical protein